MDNYFYLNREFKKSLYYSPEKRKKKVLIELFAFSLLFASFFFTAPLLLGNFYNSGNNISNGFYLKKLATSIFTGSTISNESNESEHETGETNQNNQSEAPAEQEKDLSLISKDENQRINILLIGMAGEPWPAPYLTDSIEVVSISTDKSLLVIGIPRDLLVKIPESSYETRINALYSIGGNNPATLQKAVKKITGLETQYWVVIDLTTMERIIDILGGIEVDVKKDIYDPNFPSPNRGYETFSIKAGFQRLDGKTAIKYIRSRHTAEGDFGRIERQQQVMEAIKNKITDLNIFSDLSKIFSLYKEFQGKTNLGIEEINIMLSFADKILKENNQNSSNGDTTAQDSNESNINYFSLDAGKADSFLVFGSSVLGGKTASVLWPQKGKFDYSEIKERIKQIIN